MHRGRQLRLIPNLRSTATQAIGNAWLDRRDALALRVPSSTLPDGVAWHLLFHAGHPDDSNPIPSERVAVTPFDLRHYLGSA